MSDKNTPEFAHSGSFSQTEISETYLNETELATRLSMSVKWVRKMRLTGGGVPHRKFGRSVRYALSTVIEYERASQRTSTSDQGGC